MLNKFQTESAHRTERLRVAWVGGLGEMGSGMEAEAESELIDINHRFVFTSLVPWLTWAAIKKNPY